MKNPLTHITTIHEATAQIEQARTHLIKFINDYPMSGRQKAVLFGWGINNYNHRMKSISNDSLIKAVEILNKADKEVCAKAE